MAIKGTINGFPMTFEGSVTIEGNHVTMTGIASLFQDASPQLGGNLDCNGFNVDMDNATGIRDDSGNYYLKFNKTASATKFAEITNGTALGFSIVKADAVRAALTNATGAASTTTYLHKYNAAGSGSWSLPRLPAGWTGTTTKFLSVMDGTSEFGIPIASKA